MARVDINKQLTDEEVFVLQVITAGAYFVYRETPGGTVDGSNVTFTLDHIPLPDSLCLYLNGLLQTETDDYAILGGTITFIVAPGPGDKIRASYTVDLS